MERIEIINSAAMLSVLDHPRLESLYQRAVDVADLPGSFVECGCGAGGSSHLLAHVAANHKERRLIICDTFEGLPPLQPGVDTSPGWTETMYRDVVGSSKGDMATIVESCRAVGCECFGIKGLYGDTLPNWKCGPIALLHADADWYYSTMDILTNLWSHVVPGGAIIFDDYGYWDGCKKAVDEFFAANGPAPEWHAVSCSVWGRKP